MRREIEDLLHQHKEIETKYLEQRRADEESNAKALEDVMSQGTNQQNKQNIKLEIEIQILEKCMEDMKAIYTLNEEKLKFNCEVLFERESVTLKVSR